MYRSMPSAKDANLPVAKGISLRVLCLPIYPNITISELSRVVSIIKGEK